MLSITTDNITKEELACWWELWNESANGNFFNSPGYFLSFCDAFGCDAKVVFCYKKNNLIAVVPLVRSKKMGIKTWICPDRQKRFLDKSALLLKKQDPELFQDVVREISGQMGNLFLADVASSFKSNDSVPSNGFFERETVCPRTVVCKDPLGQMKSKQRRDIPRRIKKYGKNISFSFKKEVGIGELRQMQAIENASHKQGKNTALFCDEDARRLYESFLKVAPENCRVAFLSIDGKKIAHAFGFVYKRTFLCTHMAFNHEYSNIGAGKIVIFNLLKELCKLKFCIFDFSKGDSQVKRAFMSSFPVQYNFYYSNNQLVLFWWRFAISCKSVLKKIKKQANNKLFL